MLFWLVGIHDRNINNNMANNNCNVCEKFVRSSHAYVCNVCSRKSHAKCLGIQSKFFQDVWMCNICRQDVFPFSSITHPNILKKFRLTKYFYFFQIETELGHVYMNVSFLPQGKNLIPVFL